MTRWLTDDEQLVWREWLDAALVMADQIDRDTLHMFGLHSKDYAVLSTLSEAPDRRLRMSDLALDTIQSRSRLTQQIRRLEEAGYVQREPDEQDGRGQNARLTDAGYARLTEIAPEHVRTIREYFFDQLEPGELEVFGRACARINRNLYQVRQRQGVSRTGFKDRWKAGSDNRVE